MPYAIYSLVTVLLGAAVAIYVVQGLRRRNDDEPAVDRWFLAVLCGFLLLSVWFGLITVVTDNCGAGGGCEDALEWSWAKAMSAASPPAALGMVIGLLLSRR